MLRLTLSAPSLWRWGVLFALPLLAGLALAGCDVVGEEPDRDFDEDRAFAAPPVVSGTSPSGSALAGVDEVVIAGANFSPIASENFVYFGGTRVQVISATPTELRVVPPLASEIVPTDSVSIDLDIKVGVLGAELFSPPLAYTLFDPAPSAIRLANNQTVVSIATDPNEVLYASLVRSGNSIGINRVNAEGDAFEVYLDDSSLWSGLDFDAAGVLYGARNVRAVFKAEPGSSFGTFGVSSDRSVRIATLDALADGTVWAAGNNAAVFRIDPDRSLTSFDFEANVVDIAVVGSALKLLVDPGPEGDGVRGIYSASIDPTTSDLQSAPTLEADLSALPLAAVSAFAWATSGEVFIGGRGVGGDEAIPVYVGMPGGSFAPLFPRGVVLGEIEDFAWGPSPTLYALRSFAVEGEDGPEPRNVIYAINTRDRVGI